MRKALTLILGTTLLAGCATANSNVQKVPPAAGTYNMIAIDGYGLPHKLENGDLRGQEILASVLILKPDNTFEIRTTVRAQVSTAQPIKFERQFTGTYDASAIGVQLNWRGNLKSSGAFHGRVLRIYIDGVEALYVK